MGENIFSKRVVTKSNKELLKILKNHKDYQTAFLSAVKHEISERAIEIPEEITQNLNSNNTYKVKNKSSSKDGSDLLKDISWLPKRSLFDLLNYTLVFLLAILIFSFPYFEKGTTVVSFLIILSPILPLLLANDISNDKTKRSIHLQVRLYFSLLLLGAILLRKYIVFDDTNSLLSSFATYLILLVYTGIISWPLYKFYPKFKLLKFSNFRIFKFVGILTVFVLGVLLIFKNGWFHPSGEFSEPWNEDKPITYTDFAGYPDLFTEYDAGIRSKVDIVNKENSVEVTSSFYPKYTWMNPWDKGEEYLLLQHERYHFNITEWLARLARREVYTAKNQDLDENMVTSLNKKYLSLYHKLQNLYDSETDHSVKQNIQSIWQFKIDSALTILDAYWSPKYNLSGHDSVKYYRFLMEIGDLRPMGRGNVFPYELKYSSYYQFIYENEQLREIRYFKSGKLAKDPYYGAAIIKSLIIGKNKNLQFFDENGQAINNRYGFHSLVEQPKLNNKYIYSYWDKAGNQVKGLTGELFTIIKRDTEGRILMKYFNDKNKIRVPNVLDQYELVYNYEEEHRKLSIENYHYGIRKADNNGNYLYFYEFDDTNNLIKDYQLKDDDQINQFDSIAMQVTAYDYRGFDSTYTYFDKYHNPREDEEGIWRIFTSYDRYGNLNFEALYNSNNLLINDVEGVCMKMRKYDSLGRLLNYAEYDKGGVLVFDDDGYGRIAYQRDTLGRLIEITNYNGYDYPVESTYEGPVVKISYDPASNSDTRLYFDLNGEAHPLENNLYGQIFFYDNQDNIVEVHGIDENNDLVEFQYDVAVIKYEYDSNSNKVKTSYFDKALKPASAYLGAHINTYSYDDKNRMIQRAYYDTLNNLIEFEGRAIIQWDYDDQGNNTEIRYYNKNKNLVDGLAIIKMKYNGENVVERIRVNKNLEALSDVPPLVRYQYDKNNNLISKAFYNLNGELTLDMDNVHEYKYIFERNNKIEEIYIGIDGYLTEVEGRASINYSYDQRDNIIERIYLNDKGEFHSDETGVAKVKYRYNLSDEVISERLYDNNGRLLKSPNPCTIVYERNQSGRITHQTYYDEEGILVPNSDSVGQIVRKYNRNGQLVESDSLKVSEVENLGLFQPIN